MISFELNFDFRFQFNFYTAHFEFDLHGALVNSFKKAVTKHVVDFKSRTDELLRHGLQGKILRAGQNLCFICAHLWLSHGWSKYGADRDT